ncbi:MAG: hypothetical protein AAGH38_12270, partial [Pseudomonadota bacterium]
GATHDPEQRRPSETPADANSGKSNAFVTVPPAFTTPEREDGNSRDWRQKILAQIFRQNGYNDALRAAVNFFRGVSLPTPSGGFAALPPLGFI